MNFLKKLHAVTTKAKGFINSIKERYLPQFNPINEHGYVNLGEDPEEPKNPKIEVYTEQQRLQFKEERNLHLNQEIPGHDVQKDPQEKQDASKEEVISYVEKYEKDWYEKRIDYHLNEAIEHNKKLRDVINKEGLKEDIRYYSDKSFKGLSLGERAEVNAVKYNTVEAYIYNLGSDEKVFNREEMHDRIRTIGSDDLLESILGNSELQKIQQSLDAHRKGKASGQ